MNTVQFPAHVLVLQRCAEGFEVVCLLELRRCELASRSGEYDDLSLDELAQLSILREDQREAEELLSNPLVCWEISEKVDFESGAVFVRHSFRSGDGWWRECRDLEVIPAEVKQRLLVF